VLESPRVRLSLVSCDGDDGAGARPEAWEDDHVLVVMGGRFAFRDRRRRTALAPLSVLSVRDREEFVISHPGGHGDVCLSLRGPAAEAWVRESRLVEALSANGLRAVRRVLHEGASALGLEEALHEALLPEDAPRRVTRRERHLSEAMAAEVRLRFDERLTLDALAERAGVSVFHAARVFRRVTGTSLHQYQQEVRLRHALTLLLDTELPLAQVALDAGFSSQPHLTRLFHRHYGTTPGRVRKDGAVPSPSGS
jgi:AraC family transcriptional regulator